MFNRKSSSSSQSSSVISYSISALTTLSILSLIHIKVTRTFHTYNNFLRFIWEGDHLSPCERLAVDTIEKAESNLVKVLKGEASCITTGTA